MRLHRKALLKYSTRAISTFQTQWEQHHQPRSARDTIGVQPSGVFNDMPAPVGLVASRRFPVLYLREWIYHCIGILSLVELLFASLVFKKHRCPPDLLRKATTVRSVPTRYVFLPSCFRSRHSKYLNSRLPAYDRGSSLLSYHFQECCGLDDCCTYLIIAKHLNRL